MGCGSSSSSPPMADVNNTKRQKKEDHKKEDEEEVGSDFLQETSIEAKYVEHYPSGYPAARPAREKKADIFQEEKYRDIDQHARGTPNEKAVTYEELIAHLTADLKTDLEKLRAIFVWMGSRNISTSTVTGSAVNDPDTPQGFMKLVETNRATYASFFALLCRAAKIPCVIVVGLAKSATYEVGMADEELKSLRNCWNTAYVAGGWRIVFPLWAFSALSDFRTGHFTKIETKGVAVREKIEESEGTDVSQLNEYYFLTDPEEFIFIARPDDQKWQLMAKTVTFDRFAEMPHCKSNYHVHGLNITSKFSGRLMAVNGKCTIELKTSEKFYLNYELFFNHNESGKELFQGLQLNKYVFVKRQDVNWTFGTRFPEEGIYMLQILGGHSPEDSVELCSFKITCNEPQEDCQPLPINPRIGYGPSFDTKRAGLAAVSHRNGFVVTKRCQTLKFTFCIIRHVDVMVELVHKSYSIEQLKQCVSKRIGEKILKVGVEVPEDGEYALQLFTKPQNSSEYTNACNYLLGSDDPSKVKKRKKEDTYDKMTRKHLQAMTGKGSLLELEKAIEKFEDLELEDKGDLTRAKDVRELNRIRKELLEAINRRHLNTLEKAIKHAKESKFSSDQKVVRRTKKAQKIRDHLATLNRFAHDILAMDAKTIAEIKSYTKPPVVVHDVMLGTFLMLGEKSEYVAQWEDLQRMITISTKFPLLRRVKKFDTVNVEQSTVVNVQNVLNGHTEEEARLASAGAGTFYVWLHDVLGVLAQGERF